MDIELARTFLEVIGAGSFVRAAQRLNVTQSTVSTRIKLLEEQVGARLFLRNRGGTALTPAGTQFERLATAMVRMWEQARQDIVLANDYSATLRIGGEAGLWNRWLHRWIPWMRDHAPDIALRCEVGLPDGLIQNLLGGLLDIAVTYSPQGRPTLKVELVLEEELVAVEADPPGRARDRAEQVFVDWGDEFRRKHHLAFPNSPAPALFMGLGTLGFDYLLREGGSGYFPMSLAQPHLAAGTVRPVPGVGSFHLPVYAVHPEGIDPRTLQPALAGLRAICKEQKARETAPAQRPRANWRAEPASVAGD